MAETRANGQAAGKCHSLALHISAKETRKKKETQATHKHTHTSTEQREQQLNTVEMKCNKPNTKQKNQVNNATSTAREF